MNIVEELRQKIYLEKLYKKNCIDLDNYFKYSGKQEINNRLVALTPNYRIDKTFKVFNDMSKYKLKNYKT